MVPSGDIAAFDTRRDGDAPADTVDTGYMEGLTAQQSGIERQSSVIAWVANISDSDSPNQHVFGRLLPLNNVARRAVEASYRSSNLSRHHSRFIRPPAPEHNIVEYHFEFSLDELPKSAASGWRIGSGRGNTDPVDLLLSADSADNVAGIHASFAWTKGVSGFFIRANNTRGLPVILNGEKLCFTDRVIPLGNTLLFGECGFFFEYVRWKENWEEEEFQLALTKFYKEALEDDAPIIMPTPSMDQLVLGQWAVQYPISYGHSGTVHMVTNVRTGQPRAAKFIQTNEHNRGSVENEIRVVRQASQFKHPHIVTPEEFILPNEVQVAEIQRIRALLDENWQPNTRGLQQYIIIMPLLSGNLRTVVRAGKNIDLQRRAIFFLQLLDALTYLHEDGYIHRDVKLENVVVKSYDPPCCMLTDFGCLVKEERIAFDNAGTARYLAPEQQPGRVQDRYVPLVTITAGS
jgi:hypothetical protein